MIDINHNILEENIDIIRNNQNTGNFLTLTNKPSLSVPSSIY